MAPVDERDAARAARLRWGSLPREIGDRACEMYQADEYATVASVAAELGVNSSAVYDTLRARGVPRRPRGGSAKPREADLTRARQMADEYAAGASLEQVGRSFGVSKERVRQVLDKHHPGHITAVQVARKEQRGREREARKQRELEARERKRAEALLVDRHCPVCGTAFRTHLVRRTCGDDDCAWLWRNARHLFDWQRWALMTLLIARASARKGASAHSQRVIEQHRRTGTVEPPRRLIAQRHGEPWRRLVNRLGEDGAQQLLDRRRAEAASMDPIRIEPSTRNDFV